MNNAALERKKSVKFLGLYLDEGLNWKVHIKYISKRITKFPPVLFRTNRCLDISSKKVIYSSLIYPNLTHCYTVWGNSLFTALKPLITTRKQTIRSNSLAAFRLHTQPIMNSLGLSILNQIYTYMSCNYVFEALNGLNTCNWFSRYHNVYSTQSTEYITLNGPFANSWQSISFLHISGTNAWNMLPGSIRERISYSGCKLAVRRNLLVTAVANG